jgi:hypothetical protein
MVDAPEAAKLGRSRVQTTTQKEHPRHPFTTSLLLHSADNLLADAAESVGPLNMTVLCSEIVAHRSDLVQHLHGARGTPAGTLRFYTHGETTRTGVVGQHGSD